MNAEFSRVFHSSRGRRDTLSQHSTLRERERVASADRCAPLPRAGEKSCNKVQILRRSARPRGSDLPIIVVVLYLALDPSHKAKGCTKKLGWLGTHRVWDRPLGARAGLEPLAHIIVVVLYLSSSAVLYDT